MTTPADPAIGRSRTSAPRSTHRAHAMGSGMTEEAIHRAVVRHLEYRAALGVAWFHVPNGGGRSRAEAGVLKAMGTRSGVPDILAFSGGRCFGLELKRDVGGRLSPAQLEMHERLRAAGVEVAVAHGIDEAIVTLTRWGIIR